jgi:hypothetical protein
MRSGSSVFAGEPRPGRAGRPRFAMARPRRKLFQSGRAWPRRRLGVVGSSSLPIKPFRFLTTGHGADDQKRFQTFDDLVWQRGVRRF